MQDDTVIGHRWFRAGSNREGSLTDPGIVDEIDRAYVDALATGPSARERASTRDHLVFLAEMLPDPSLKLKLDVPAGELQRLIKRLQ